MTTASVVLLRLLLSSSPPAADAKKEQRELFPSKGQQLGNLQAWGTSSLVLSFSVHVNTACGCDHGPMGTILTGKAGEQLYWLQNSAPAHGLC